MAPITGRKVLIFTLAAFGIVIAANLTLAVQAVRTFPGLETANSYVASQRFERDRAAQQALGWSVDVGYDGGELRVAITDSAGAAVAPAQLAVTVGRATTDEHDVTPALALADGAYAAPVALGPGRWLLRLSAVAADGTEFRQRLSLTVPRPSG